MKSLFIRDFDNHKALARNEITEGCEWVLNGEGIATKKYDGTCCLIQYGKIYKRFDYKIGRKLPEGAIPCQDMADSITGHFPHWVECKKDNPSDKWHLLAFENQFPLNDGTYELCGIHFQNNIDRVSECNDKLIPHGTHILNVGRSYEEIRQFLENNYIEGIVFHRGNGEMTKIKRSDFGFEWGNKKR